MNIRTLKKLISGIPDDYHISIDIDNYGNIENFDTIDEYMIKDDSKELILVDI